MRPRTRTALAAAAIAVTVPVALAQAAPSTGQTAHATQSKVSMLFVTEGPIAQMAPVEGQAGTYTFTMPIRTAKQPVIWFTDRPARDAGTLSMRNFVGLWSAPGTNTFATIPPNVAIVYTSGGKQKTFIATMTSPVIIPSTAISLTLLQATMTAVPEELLATHAKGKGKLAKHAKKAHRNPVRFPASSLIVRTPSVFVDSWSFSGDNNNNQACYYPNAREHGWTYNGDYNGEPCYTPPNN
ncbi:MAG: hypothetical protein O2976_04910 [Actinomycetota bacterium]|nr:hypothetical protein [Actinomycetota bacterium]